MVIRAGSQIVHAQTWKNLDATAVVGRVSQAYENKMFDAIGIDSIGVRSRVFDMIKNIQIPCVAVNVGESSSKKEKYREDEGRTLVVGKALV